jgi:hypothetical protein
MVAERVLTKEMTKVVSTGHVMVGVSVNKMVNMMGVYWALQEAGEKVAWKEHQSVAMRDIR